MKEEDTKYNKNYKLILLNNFSTYSEAKTIQVLLEKNNIKSLMQASGAGGAMLGKGSSSGPQDLFIKEMDLSKAREILEYFSNTNLL